MTDLTSRALETMDADSREYGGQERISTDGQ